MSAAKQLFGYLQHFVVVYFEKVHTTFKFTMSLFRFVERTSICWFICTSNPQCEIGSYIITHTQT